MKQIVEVTIKNQNNQKIKKVRFPLSQRLRELFSPLFMTMNLDNL